MNVANLPHFIARMLAFIKASETEERLTFLKDLLLGRVFPENLVERIYVITIVGIGVGIGIGVGGSLHCDFVSFQLEMVVFIRAILIRTSTHKNFYRRGGVG